MYNNLTPVVRNLLLVNVCLFFAQDCLGLALVDVLGLRCVFSEHFRLYQFFTHLFLHASLGHLFSNMLALYTLGPVLERMLTARWFVVFYFLTGLGAAGLYAGVQYLEVRQLAALYHAYWAQPGPAGFLAYLQHHSQGTYAHLYAFADAFFDHATDLDYVAKSKAIVQELYASKADMLTVGASGAVFGIFTGFTMLFPNAALLLFFLPVPIKARYLLPLYLAYELYAGIRYSATDNVAHFAHLGGIVFAYLFMKWWQQRPAGY